MKSRVANRPLADLLDGLTALGAPELCRPEAGGVRCLACGHRCLVGDGLRGVCKVRFNDAGRLKVPFGYVAGLQCDPVEKKPFFHVYPGSDALTFGMMGCDLHCSYCFPGDTLVMTDRGPITLEGAFSSASRVQQMPDAEIAYPSALRAVAGSGALRSIQAVFKHPYRGPLTVLRPYYLPELRCTPDHRVYATTDPAVPPQPTRAGELTTRHFLAIPRHHAFSSGQTIDAAAELADHRMSYRVPWELSVEDRQWIAEATARGETSRQIGAVLGKSASYIRHVRSKLARGRGEDVRAGALLLEEGTVRFPNEHRPGIPQHLGLDVGLARLLGFYCAEGCVTQSGSRPNSYTLNFSFSPDEGELVEEVRTLIQQRLGLRAHRVERATTLAVAVSKTSAGLLFKRLAGSGAAEKRVPPQMFDAPREIVRAFLDAYLEGDGHRYPGGKVTATTVSRELAYGVAFLALKLGFLPSVYDYPRPADGVIQGRPVQRSPHQYTVVWYEQQPSTRHLVETDRHYFVPLREVSAVDYEGDVYNMEVEEEHNYLAGLFLVKNCQNWLTSQALRDADAVTPVRRASAAQLIDVARRENARLVVSSYNEPLITAEWAVEVFRAAGAAGLACAFVSNGNATPEALDYLRPWIVAYKVDLKSFDDRHYRTLGCTLNSVTSTIRMVHERGLWLEVVTLVIPGFNDDPGELRRAADFLASVSPDVPWHLTAFHKDYKMTGPEPTRAETLVRAAEIGTAAGLRFVYAGNLPGRVGPWEDTRCPGCRVTLIRRTGYLVRSYEVGPGGRCPHCQTPLPGVWPAQAEEVRTGNDLNAYRSRLPRQVDANRPGSFALPVLQVGPEEKDEGGRMKEEASSAFAPFHLTDPQRDDLLAAVAAMLRDATAGRPVVCPPLPWADRPVGGAYVSLKRGGHLRSCCGVLTGSVSLRAALGQATASTAREDARFPPLSPTELPHLDLEVWLLHPPRPVEVRGESRAAAVTVGRHGVQVIRGQSQALFLPGVAVENGWDARKTLDRLCLKAQMPPTAWREDDTALFTFEGESFATHLQVEGWTPTLEHLGLGSPQSLASYLDFCRRELTALLTGSTPMGYLWGAADGRVNGVLLHLHRPGGPTLTSSQISLRPGVPLQATLAALLQATARQLADEGIRREALASLEVGLTLLHDPAVHGSVARAHLAGCSADRAVLVLERNKSALLLDPSRPPEDLLAEGARQACVRDPNSASVISLAALSSVGRVSVATVPKVSVGPADRPPAVAGTFYEADAAALAGIVDALLGGTDSGGEDWPAAMVPHAGLRFSGRIAAGVLKRLRIPKTVIVIGPKHTPLGVDWAVAPHRRWLLPGGSVESDVDLARALCDAVDGLEPDAAAHQGEHGVEVELPLIARLAPWAKVVGIAVGEADLDGCRRFAAGVAGVLRGREDPPLLLVSSDMNHYASDAETRRLDEMALSALETGDPELLYSTVRENEISMCGVLPAVIVLETLRLLGRFRRAERAGHAKSADVTGDTSRVVGYAGMLFG
jgi:AmmeMemoRadiSam system protein B/AmmeMemoRadiSam system radical SAM enzyme/AmmeMemoRadiSam system protein A